VSDTFHLPVDFALLCSETSLQNLELATLNRASLLRKELLAVLDELARCEGEALFARWMRDHRGELLARILEQTRADERQLRFFESPQK
jgi:hypothetical protein